MPPVDHFDRLVLFFGHKGNRVAFRAIEAHGFNMSIMAESDFPHPLDRILDISPPILARAKLEMTRIPINRDQKRRRFTALPP